MIWNVVELIWALVWLVALVAAAGVVLFFAYATIDWIHERLYGYPWLPETERDRRNAG